MSKITLEDMEFHAFHGCLEHEQQLGNTFLVSVVMELDTAKAEITDDLSDTLNYKLVYDVVKEEMNIPSKLIEHVAYRIKKSLQDRFAFISLEIKLTKLSPPVGGKMKSVSIEI